MIKKKADSNKNCSPFKLSKVRIAALIENKRNIVCKVFVNYNEFLQYETE